MKLELKIDSWKNIIKVIQNNEIKSKGNFWAAIQSLEAQIHKEEFPQLNPENMKKDLIKQLELRLENMELESFEIRLGLGEKGVKKINDRFIKANPKTLILAVNKSLPWEK